MFLPVPGPGFSAPYVVVFFVIKGLRLSGGLIVRFVDISEIVDHHR